MNSAILPAFSLSGLARLCCRGYQVRSSLLRSWFLISWSHNQYLKYHILITSDWSVRGRLSILIGQIAGLIVSDYLILLGENVRLTVDGVAAVQGVQVLAIIEVPQHGLAVLLQCDWSVIINTEL